MSFRIIRDEYVPKALLLFKESEEDLISGVVESMPCSLFHRMRRINEKFAVEIGFVMSIPVSHCSDLVLYHVPDGFFDGYDAVKVDRKFAVLYFV